MAIKLTARQARVLWGILGIFLDPVVEAKARDGRVLKTIAEVRRKLER